MNTETGKIKYNELIDMTLEEFYNKNIGLVKSIALSEENKAKADRYGIPFDELFSTGIMGLIHAYKNYSLLNVKPSTYVGKSVGFFVRRLLIEEGNVTIRIPYDVRMDLITVRRDKEAVDENNRIKLTAKEISERFGFTLYNAESILICEDLDRKTQNAYRFEESDDVNKIKANSRMKSQKDSVDNLYIKSMLSVLTEREAFIVERKMEGYNNSEIAQMIGGITRQAIDNIVKRNIRKKMSPILQKEGFDVPKEKRGKPKQKVFYQRSSTV